MPSEHAHLLKAAMEQHITSKFGHAVPPSPYVTPFGIRTLDALLGGGIQSSAPISISSTPETGKTTLCLQFAATFQRQYEDCMVININIEEAASGAEKEKEPEDNEMKATVQILNAQQQSTMERITNFGIDLDRFINKPVELNVKEVFDLINDLVTIKTNVQNKLNKEWKMLIIWDSIAYYLGAFISNNN